MISLPIPMTYFISELYSDGDFIALYLVDGYVEFAINLGDGVTIAR